MRFLKIILLFLVFVSPFIVKAQLIEWREDRPLTWDDFQGRPDYGRTAAAMTVWSIRYSYHYEFQDSIYKVTFSIKSFFDTQKSWAKRWILNNDYALGHEQLHFDITELCTRKLAAAFHSAVYTANFKAEINEIYNKYLDECRKMQSKYDTETNFSNNRNMQYRWQIFIYTELKKLPRNY